MKETKLQRQLRRFNDGEIDKFEFYSSTKWYSAKRIVAEGAKLGVFDGCIDPLGVVRDRRHYINHQLPLVGRRLPRADAPDL